jgi:hypothetical protein
VLLFVPLTILSIWLSSGGYQNFSPSNHYAMCKKTGECTLVIGMSRTEILEAALSRVHIGGLGDIEIIGGINETIRIIEPASERRLNVPPSRSNYGGCSLSYYRQLDKQEWIEGSSKTVSSLQDAFSLDCGPYSQSYFRFKNKEVHTGLITALNSGEALRRKFNEDQRSVSTRFFFVPFILFFAVWAFVYLMAKAFNFVRFGKTLPSDR